MSIKKCNKLIAQNLRVDIISYQPKGKGLLVKQTFELLSQKQHFLSKRQGNKNFIKQNHRFTIEFNSKKNLRDVFYLNVFTFNP